MALAVLSKGLVGLILPGAVLVLYTVIARDWAMWKRLHLIGGLIVFFAIVTPWFVLVQQRNPEFLNFFFIVQQFKRYLTPEQNRPGAFYYFVPVLLVGFLPWLSVTFAERAPRMAPAAPAERLRARHADDGLDRLHLPVLQRLALEAAVLHAADRPADRAADRHVPAARHARRSCAAIWPAMRCFSSRPRSARCSSGALRQRTQSDRAVHRISQSGCSPRSPSRSC